MLLKIVFLIIKDPLSHFSNSDSELIQCKRKIELNSLFINIKKTKAMFFFNNAHEYSCQIMDKKIETVSKIKFLGFYLDSKFKHLNKNLAFVITI